MTTAFEPTEFAREFQAFLQGVNRLVPTDGVSAAFVRELVRRAVLLAADEAGAEATEGGGGAVGERQLLAALAALDASSAPLRRLLGAGAGS